MTIIDNSSEAGEKKQEKSSAESPVIYLTYIKPVIADEGIRYAVCSEEGIELALFGTREAAFFSARQHNLTPLSLH